MSQNSFDQENNLRADHKKPSHANKRASKLYKTYEDPNHAGSKTNMENKTKKQTQKKEIKQKIRTIAHSYIKIKCINCGYEMATMASRPKCYKCGHRRFSEIQDFSVVKPYKIQGGVKQNMAKEKKEKETPKEEAEDLEEAEEETEDEDDELDNL